jgi:hypothetical protein
VPHTVTASDVPDEIRDLCHAFQHGLEVALGRKLYATYLYGALAFPEGGATGDIDFHVILSEPLNDREKGELEALHAVLARDYPPLGEELDGYYVLLADARQSSPPPHQFLPNVVDESWALNRAHILAGRCIVLHGPDPRQLYLPPSWLELECALQGELDYVERHLDRYPAYCVLNLCRLMYSFETGDVVVSKRASAAWADAAFPEWRPLIQAARNSYDRQAMPYDRDLLESKAHSYFEFACAHIGKSRCKAGNS